MRKLDPRELVAAGALVSAGDLAAAWHTSPEDLDAACARGELSGNLVERVRHYPRAVPNCRALW